MAEKGPIREDRRREDLDTSYEDEIQAGVDRLAETARRLRRRNTLWSIGALVVLLVMVLGGLLLMRACKAGEDFEDSFRWLRPRRR